MTIEVKAAEQYFPMVLFIMFFEVVPTFEFVDEILKNNTIQMKSYFKSVGAFVLQEFNT